MSLIDYTISFSKKLNSKRDRHAYLMIQYTESKDLDDLRLSINPNDVHVDNYKMDDIHVTLAELNNHLNINKLRKLLLPINQYTLKLDSLSIFEQPGYDVLKCDVKTKNLIQTNKNIYKNFTSRSRFKYYNPHVTVCKLKKGAASKYIGKINPIHLTPYQFHLSYYNKIGKNDHLYWR